LQVLGEGLKLVLLLELGVVDVLEDEGEIYLEHDLVLGLWRRRRWRRWRRWLHGWGWIHWWR